MYLPFEVVKCPRIYGSVVHKCVSLLVVPIASPGLESPLAARSMPSMSLWLPLLDIENPRHLASPP